MKNVLVLILFVSAFAGKVFGQQPQTAISKEKIAPLLAWTGNWKGEGSMMTPSGETRKSSVDEKVEAKLDNTIIMMEGLGKYTDPSTQKEVIAHHAIGILSYDLNTKQYKIRSYLKDGRGTEGWFNVVAENNYQWGFDTPGGKMRYTIVLDPGKKTWNEIGEFSRDGNEWRKIFEMNLTRVD